MTTNSRIGAFWNWFCDWHEDVATAFANNDWFWLDTNLTEEVRHMERRLNWEMGPYHHPENTLVITPSVRDNISVAQRVVAAAPQLAGWHFLPAKPPKAVGTLAMELPGITDTHVCADQWVYRLTSYNLMEFFDIEVFTDYTGPASDKQLELLARRLIELLVGEEIYLTKFAAVTVQGSAFVLYICGGDDPMPRFYHFTTRADYEQLANSYKLFSTLYFLSNPVFLHTEEVPFTHGLLALPDLGRMTDSEYYVFPELPKLGVLPLPDYQGMKRFTLDGSTFPVCLVFRPNGLFGRNCLLCGHVEITNPVGVTRDLYKEIAKCFAKEYQKGKYYHCITYVGPDAWALRKKRYRLCANPNLPRADDFKVETLVK